MSRQLLTTITPYNISLVVTLVVAGAKRGVFWGGPMTIQSVNVLTATYTFLSFVYYSTYYIQFKVPICLLRRLLWLYLVLPCMVYMEECSLRFGLDLAVLAMFHCWMVRRGSTAWIWTVLSIRWMKALRHRLLLLQHRTQLMSPLVWMLLPLVTLALAVLQCTAPNFSSR